MSFERWRPQYLQSYGSFELFGIGTNEREESKVRLLTSSDVKFLPVPSPARDPEFRRRLDRGMTTAPIAAQSPLNRAWV